MIWAGNFPATIKIGKYLSHQSKKKIRVQFGREQISQEKKQEEVY
jgi:hypothetical protein